MSNSDELDSDDPHSDYDFDAPYWPVEVFYSTARGTNVSMHAMTFLANRPDELIVSDGDIYSLGCFNVWDHMTDDDLKVEIRATNPNADVLDIHDLRNMVQEIKIVRMKKARPFEWINEPTNAPRPQDLILCANGILNAATGKLLDLTSDYFATALPAWEFDPAAECPLWMEKLNEWLHPSYHKTLQEFTGYLLVPDVSYHAMLALLGETRGGKGTVTRIQSALVGLAHCAFPSFNDIAGDFGLEGFGDKRALFVPDAHDVPKDKRGLALERLKSIAAGDPVTVNRKGIKQVLDARLVTKIVLTANQHPKLLDESGALAAREILVMFERSFADRKDPELTNKLLAELSGIANWAIEGLRRLRWNNGEFSVGERGAKLLEDLKAEQSTALRFANACCEVTGDKSDVLPLPLAYRAYQEWASNVEGLHPRQRRDKTAFKEDMMAALRKRGVTWAEKQVRWHDPCLPRKREGDRVKHRFVGIKLRREAHPDASTDDG
ncbi:phage/plasmid primase, P4 family [Bradyrhizobium sp. CB3481]|uniref:DNA primase family protein n=1 Tax=Bradyrhizobium sp. CB3481 TaxID=3039158 RepID=UPI0024B1F795|nr:phage/plasmid primase, P4 family [Bradyrhizobium sp. CB3481]WFU16435.1 phage/plasmid primase, P4 family [Bradyrhizobium sp. CB3481]